MQHEERSLNADDEAFLRAVLTDHPQVKTLAGDVGVSVEEAVGSSIRLIVAGRLRVEEQPDGGFILVPIDADGNPPAMRKPKKRRLFRP